MLKTDYRNTSAPVRHDSFQNCDATSEFICWCVYGLKITPCLDGRWLISTLNLSSVLLIETLSVHILFDTLALCIKLLWKQPTFLTTDNLVLFTCCVLVQLHHNTITLKLEIFLSNHHFGQLFIPQSIVVLFTSSLLSHNFTAIQIAVFSLFFQGNYYYYILSEVTKLVPTLCVTV